MESDQPTRVWRSLRWILAGSVVLAILLLAVFPEIFPRDVREEAPEAKNILIIGIDTLRADHVSAYGYSRVTTPNIDMIGRQGVVFENCVSVSPWTLPSFFSIMTSTYPSTHLYGTNMHGLADPVRGIANHWTMGTISPDYEIRTLAEVFRKQGYRTGAFVNNPFLSTEQEMDRGFDDYVEYKPTAEKGVELVLPWLDRHRADKVFLFIHIMDPHDYFIEREPPDDIPQRFGGGADPGMQAVIDRYDSAVYYVDQQIGRIMDHLKKLGAEDDTLVVVTSDHGEEFSEHGGTGHGRTLYDELLSVPLIMRFPQRAASGTRVARRVSTLDIAPTIVESAGLPLPSYFTGQSLRPLLHGEKLPDRPIFAEAVLYGHEKKAVLMKEHKLIYTTTENRFELFDLRRDRPETKNLDGESKGIGSEMKLELQSFLSESVREVQVILEPRGKFAKLEGRLRVTGGIFTKVVPLDLTRPEVFRTSRNSREIALALGAEHSANGISFNLDPYEASVEFDIISNDSGDPVNVYLGAGTDGPRVPPVTFDKKTLRELGPPLPESGQPAEGVYVYLKGAERESKPMTIDRKTKEELEALGYLN